MKRERHKKEECCLVTTKTRRISSRTILRILRPSLSRTCEARSARQVCVLQLCEFHLLQARKRREAMVALTVGRRHRRRSRRRKGNINIGVTSTLCAGLQTCRTGVGSAAAGRQALAPSLQLATERRAERRRIRVALHQTVSFVSNQPVSRFASRCKLALPIPRGILTSRTG